MVCCVAIGLCWVAPAAAYDVYCRDGTISHSGGRQGACSYHGGVAGPVGGGIAPVTPVAPVAPSIAPTDVIAPTLAALSYTGPGAVTIGRSVTPPQVSVSDDVAWPANPGGYAVTLTWGDGVAESILFGGVADAYVPVTLSLPAHTYADAGRFSPTLVAIDPAGHTTTVTLFTVTVSPPLAVPDGYPRLVGKARVGRTLRCLVGDWGDPDAKVRFRWLLNGYLIRGQTRPTLLLHQNAQGRHAACRVSVGNAGGNAQATSRSRHVAPKPVLRTTFVSGLR